MPRDALVTARMVLQAQLELQRVGHRRAIATLESQERDLADHFLESSTDLYHRILDAGVEPRQARRIYRSAEAIVLVSIMALRKAHAALWAEGVGQEIQTRLEAPPSVPPHDPAA